eukprot:5622401-Prymnesium_polylepis.1
MIYTLVGTVLVAMNPCANINVYGEQVMTEHVGAELGAHIYSMGEAAYRSIVHDGASAALIMSGESGAGKTETAKHVMRYLAWRSNPGGGGGGGGVAQRLADMIVCTSPLLEAFGNAKTVRNDNSSRFGKMMRLHFSASGAMASAH